MAEVLCSIFSSCAVSTNWQSLRRYGFSKEELQNQQKVLNILQVSWLLVQSLTMLYFLFVMLGINPLTLSEITGKLRIYGERETTLSVM